MAKTLRICHEISLPIDAVTEPIGIFANRGKGKSNAAHRLVEQLYHAGLPAIVLDIKGDWYGIRSSADGKGDGLPFLIFGGDHEDVPLEVNQGADVALFLAQQRIPAIIDMSGFSKTQARRWVMEFAEELYRVNTQPLMLVVDEADVLIPQRLAAELMRLLGAMEDIAKRGRKRGLGICVISQRIADVNKSVTDLLETLFLFAITGTRTRKAVLEWIDDHADAEEAKAVVATLSSLEPGECWVWSPGWLRLLKRIRFLRPETFDSHATPKAGEKPQAIKTMADIDLTAVRGTFAATLERKAESDPGFLRRRITELERQVKSLEAKPVAAELVHVPYIPEEFLDQSTVFIDLVTDMRKAIEEMEFAHAAMTLSIPDVVLEKPKVSQSPIVTTPPSPPPKTETPVRAIRAGDSDIAIGKCERSILSVLAQHPNRTRTQLCLLTGYSATASTIDVGLSKLRRLGWITPTGLIALTDEGAPNAQVEPLPTGRALLDHWYNLTVKGRRVMGKVERAVLDYMIGIYPTETNRSALCWATNYSPDASTIDVALSKLRRLEILDGWKVSDDFMEAIR